MCFLCQLVIRQGEGQVQLTGQKYSGLSKRFLLTFWCVCVWNPFYITSGTKNTDIIILNYVLDQFNFNAVDSM